MLTHNYMNKKSTNFQTYLKQQLKNPEIKKRFNAEGKQLEIAYRILQLRKEQGMSQSSLARRLGTTQSNVARIEAGQQNYTTITLQKIARAFRRDLRVEFV